MKFSFLNNMDSLKTKMKLVSTRIIIVFFILYVDDILLPRNDIPTFQKVKTMLFYEGFG